MRRALLASGLVGLAAAKKIAEIDAMKHEIQEVYARNFDSVIGTALPLTVSSVLYFKGGSKADRDFLEKYNEVAAKTKKMLKVSAMDCEGEGKKHCDRVGVKETPHVQLYPQTPRPNFKYEGEMSADAILKTLYKLIPSDKVSTLATTEEYNTFKRKNPTKPKMILFSDKKKAPTILKGLSTDSVFVRTVEFAFVGPEADAVASEAGAKKKKMPAVMLVAKGKATWYKEKDLSFAALHEWINVNSESGMGDTVKGVDGASEVEAEEIEYEKVRELHSKSAAELCYKQTSICAIMLVNGKVEDKDADMIVGFESKFAPKNDRGVKYNWMWLDISQETDFKKTLDEQEKKVAAKEDRDEEPLTYPTMIFVKPPKKKREEKLLTYVRMESGSKVSASSVGSMVERIGSGATYTRADLPKFSVRAKPEKKKNKKDEL
eukprot:g11196.t1